MPRPLLSHAEQQAYLERAPLTLTTAEWRLTALALRRLSGDVWGMAHSLEGTPGDHSAVYEELSNRLADIDTLLAKIGMGPSTIAPQPEDGGRGR